MKKFLRVILGFAVTGLALWIIDATVLVRTTRQLEMGLVRVLAPHWPGSVGAVLHPISGERQQTAVSLARSHIHISLCTRCTVGLHAS